MRLEREIEFKNMVTEREFNRLAKALGLEDADFQEQVSVYFDTPDGALKERESALRLRTAGGRAVLTLKAARGGAASDELTVDVTEEEQRALLERGAFPAGCPVVPPDVADGLRPLGSIRTHRASLPYEGGELFLDRSFYGAGTDFEVEYETADAAEGERRFCDLLARFHIPARPAEKKIARMLKGGSANWTHD